MTHKVLGGPALWAFMAGRGSHEKVYGELKSGFAFACVPTMQYAANSAFETIHTLRALCFQRAGVLVQPQGRAPLDVGSVPAVAECFKRLDRLSHQG